MADSTAIAIASVSATALTAIATPIVSATLEARREEKRFLRERQVKDFDELRQLLDDAAQAIWRYIDVVGSLESKHSTAETTEPLEFSDALIAFSDQRTAMYRLNQRLVIRLGRRHPVVSAYGRALKVLDEAGNNVATMIALEQTAEKELMATRVKARPTWYAAYEGYLDAAQELVGSPVEPISQS